jgi:hypothetical protein
MVHAGMTLEEELELELKAATVRTGCLLGAPNLFMVKKECLAGGG